VCHNETRKVLKLHPYVLNAVDCNDGVILASQTALNAVDDGMRSWKAAAWFSRARGRSNVTNQLIFNLACRVFGEVALLADTWNWQLHCHPIGWENGVPVCPDGQKAELLHFTGIAKKSRTKDRILPQVGSCVP
jgi:hypothetical protein